MVKKLFSMQLDETQTDIMDYLIEFRFRGQASKAFYLNDLVLQDAVEFLGYPGELAQELDAPMILDLLQQYSVEKEQQMIESIGEMRYEMLMEKFNTKTIDNKEEISEDYDVVNEDGSKSKIVSTVNI